MTMWHEALIIAAPFLVAALAAALGYDMEAPEFRKGEDNANSRAN